MEFHFLYEEDYASNNVVTVYVPELRISAVGDTYEEARDNTIDSIKAFYEATSQPKNFSSKVEMINLDISQLITSNPAAMYKAI
ncbi:type II toxin-antitoxin system HicB family antitoxin (plasmid) [Paenibacillus sonchi]|uniref:Type II toxin-antitoxin system HicB family antitoxin n=1 Tax=Paenibacillus sonchi TaxID=373687 RepID=A0A974SFC5_9BACL|nr:hypothetical protein [Paenibacillus sonchi]QQZ64468.1 type II toxin-antitoxin system HicB family antitoxin [Paenibacillus sonchi]